MKRIILSGGGTGGHIYPAVAVAEALKRRFGDGVEILFVGAEGKMEMEKVPALGYRIVGLPIAGLQRRLDWRNLAVPFKAVKSIRMAKRIIRDFGADAVVGFGGYASAPVLWAAQRMGVPTVIQEQNSYAGVTNKILAKGARRICTAYEGMERFFPAAKISLTGNPLRGRFSKEGAVFQVAADRTPDLRELGADLVVTPREQFDLDQRVVRPRPERRVTQARLLGVALRGVAGPRTVGPAVAQDIMAQFAALGIGCGFGQRPVELMEAAFADHLVQTDERLRRLGENDGSAHRAVDAVHHAEEHLAGFGVAPFDEGLDLVLEGALARRVGQQIAEGIEFHRNRYRSAQRYLVYFQAFSNTYAPLERLKRLYDEALAHPGVAGIVVGTRPDCVDERKLDYFAGLARDRYVALEYGIESTFDATLRAVNRGHDFACARRAVEMTAARGLHVGAHFILGLPGETDAMLLDQVERINALPLTTVKFHQLQVFRATPMAAEYDAAPERFRFWEPEEYIDLFVEILRRLRPGVVVERFASEAPPRYHYGRNWGLVRNEQLLAMLEKRLEERNVYQGEIFTTFAADKLRQR